MTDQAERAIGASGGALSTSQVARVLGLSPDRVRQLSRSGRPPCITTPIGRMFEPAEVGANADRHRSPTDTEHGHV